MHVVVVMMIPVMTAKDWICRAEIQFAERGLFLASCTACSAPCRSRGGMGMVKVTDSIGRCGRLGSGRVQGVVRGRRVSTMGTPSTTSIVDQHTSQADALRTFPKDLWGAPVGVALAGWWRRWLLLWLVTHPSASCLSAAVVGMHPTGEHRDPALLLCKRKGGTLKRVLILKGRQKTIARVQGRDFEF